MKKDYAGFWMFMLFYVTAMICSALWLPIKDNHLMTRVMLCQTTLQIEILMLIMYFADRIYWVNGISFEEAEAAGPERRKAYAGKLVKRFGILALVCMVSSTLLHIMHASIGNDIIIVLVGSIGCAISIIPIKL